MSTDFDHMLASLTTDADRVRLATADQLRAAGDARSRRRFVAATSTVVAVVAILVGAGIALAGYRPMTSEPVPIGSVPTFPSPSTVPTQPSTAPTTPPNSAAVAGAPCTATALLYDSMRSEGAAGTVYYTFRFHNGGSVSCSVQGSPELTYVDTGGATHTIPVVHGPGGAAILLEPGQAAQLVTNEINGYGGYGQGAPECAHPVTYHQVGVVVAGGSVSLKSDGTMSVQCGSITVESWSRPTS
jgi:hypothetical protein